MEFNGPVEDIDVRYPLASARAVRVFRTPPVNKTVKSSSVSDAPAALCERAGLKSV